MKPSYSKEAKCPCNYTSRSCNKPRCTVSYQDHAKLRKAIPFGRERTKRSTLHSLGPLGRGVSVRLGENEGHHFSYPRNKKSRMTAVTITESFLIGRWAPCQSGEPFTDYDTYSLRANTFSSDQLECSFCSKFSVLLSQIYKTNDKQYPDNYLLRRLIDLGCCFCIIKAWGPRSTPQVNGSKGHL